MNHNIIKAIENNEFKLLYQPIVKTSTGEAIAVEALIRWENSELGYIPPDTFIPQAEDDGSIQELGLWVIIEACKQQSSWVQSGFRPLPISINVSVKQLEKPQFSHRVNQILKDNNLEPNLLIIEVTETAKITNKVELIKNLANLEKIGHKIAIDDFGSGHSSLAYLIELPTDYIKIDGQFSKYLTSKKHLQKASRLLNDLSSNSKFDVIAEGIESKEEADKLVNIGGNYAQGFYFSKPLTADAFADKYLSLDRR